ncbi:MAG TPA: hypothetical protein VGE45_01720 [Chloroflexia bacterium]|jgi:hypothetical protein
MAIRKAHRLVSRLGVLLILLAGFASATNSAAGLSSQTSGPAEIQYHTVATFQTGTSASFVNTASLVGAGSDWVAYTLSYYACGHCGFVPTKIGLRNDYDRTDKLIKAAVDSSRGDPASIEYAQFVMPYLIWKQPARPNPAQAANFAPGDFDCSLCYYDVTTGKGGQFADLAGLGFQVAAPLTVGPMSLDRQGSGRVMMWVHPAQTSGLKVTGSIWIVNLKTGEKTMIYSLPQAAYISEMVMSGDLAVWLQDPTETGQDVYAFRLSDSAPHKINVAGRLNSIKTNGSSLFAWKTDDTTAYANGGVIAQINPDTGAATPIPNTSFTYDVYGDRLAWFIEAQPAIYNLVDKSVISSDPITVVPYNPQVTNRQLVPWLDHDQFTFSIVTFGGNGTVYDHMIGQAWLLAPNSSFNNQWAKSDLPVLRGSVNRSWLWGIRGQYHGWERYDQAPGGKRLVQYFDKARMEINNPAGNPNDPYFVTNGLLTVEMVGGEISFGDEMQITASVPCTIPVAGDPRKDNLLTPGYSALRGVASIHGENQAPNRTGQYVNEAIDVNGVVRAETTNTRASKYVAYVSQTGHNIPDVFNSYLGGMKADFGYDWTFALGYPITEAYWTKMMVQHQEYPVMIQAYQRRVLTYVPSLPQPWKVQMGNVGQHYFEWRYTQNSEVSLP